MVVAQKQKEKFETLTHLRFFVDMYVQLSVQQSGYYCNSRRSRRLNCTHY